MLFKLTLILLLAIFIVFTIIYYMFSYKRLMVISSPIFMGPLSEISINKLRNMASNDPTSKTGIEIQNMLTNMLTYSSTDLDIPFLNKTFTHDKLLVNHNDFGYSYTFFIKIDNLDYKYNEEKEIFRKGDAIDNINNPRLFLDKKVNNIIIHIDTHPLSTSTTNHTEKIVLENIPIQSWLFIGMTLHNKTVDIYINGQLSKSHTLEKLPKNTLGTTIKYGEKKGFDGSLNDLIYYFYPLSSLDMLHIYNKSQHLLNDTTDTKKKLDALMELEKSKHTIQKCYE
jgi:hypothetical protein